jgi:hypothetical protein
MFEGVEGPARDAWTLLRSGAFLHQLTGPLKGSDRPVAITCVGPAALEEQCSAFLGGAWERKLSAALRPDVLVVVEPLRVPLADVLRYSPFLDAVLDVAPSVEAQIRAVRSKAHRRRLRKASRGREWAWSVGARPEDLEGFYRTLHRPYVEARFGDKQRHAPLEGLQRRLARGGLVLTVTHRGEPACGAALFDTPDGLDYDRNGFRLDALKSPVLLSERTAALELAIFQLAQELSARTIYLGFCRALVDDGLFTHKRRLGCRFVPERGSGRSQLWVRPALRPRFFAAVPLVMGPCGEFEVHVGLSQDSASLTRIQLRALLKNFAIPAVRRAVVWTDVEALDPRRRSFEEALRAALGERDVEIRESRENGRPTLNPSAPAACAR